MVELVTFPALSNANEDGLLAMGGDLSVNTLVSAYSQGIFPWFNDEQPILWWSPDPRLVLYPEQLKISKSLAKVIRQQRYDISCDQAFSQVVRCCALRGSERTAKHDKGSNETWITKSMYEAYSKLFSDGYAHSIEVWQTHEGQRRLVGGLYGVVLGKVFFGESMFSSKSNTSKIALFALCRWLQELKFKIIDCQVASQHLLSLGAQEIPRDVFLSYLDSVDISNPSNNFNQDFESVVCAASKNCYK